jgi:mono/diheme cytochrome c family protein
MIGAPVSTSVRDRRKARALRAIVAVVTILLPGCTRIDNTLAKVPIFAFMREAPSFDPYEHPLPPPPGSVPYISPNGEELAPMEASEAAFAAFESSPQGRNPLGADDPAALALGRIMYERHCFVCHGADGSGNGPVAAAYPPGFVLPLNSGTALGRSDGYVYGVIRAGRGRMPAYGARMTHIERWAVVTYVNTLQGGAVAPAAAPGDVNAGQGAADAAPTDATTSPAAQPPQQ